MTLQCTASLPLLKVIHTGGKLDLRLGVTHCGSCDTTGLVAAMHRGPGIAAASLLAPETLSSPGLSSSSHTAIPGTAGTEAGFVSAYPEAASLLQQGVLRRWESL